MLDVLQEVIAKTVSASMPISLVDGVVLTPLPDITIQVGNDKLIIDADQIVISQRLLPRTDNFEIVQQEYKTTEEGPYRPIWIRGELQFTDEVQVGETLLMLRYEGGQKYYVIDRGVSYGTDS